MSAPVRSRQGIYPDSVEQVETSPSTMPTVTVVRVATLLERYATNVLAAVLRTAMWLLTRLTGRGRHRSWRRRGEEEQQRRQQNIRP
jgi:hypothetical protein